MREMRSISFTERESIQAIIDLMRKQKAKLPAGQVVGLELIVEPISANLMIEDNDGKRTHIHRTAAELAASLVNYCLERKVRLPNAGRKFVEVIGGTLNLLVYMEEVSTVSRRTTRPPSKQGLP
jgi:hypothetical protein